MTGGRGRFLDYSPDSKYLLYDGQPIAIHSNEAFYQWDIATGKEARRWEAPEAEITKYLFSPDGKTLFSGGASIRAWDFATGQERYPDADHRAAIETLVFSRDGKSLATLDAHHRLRVWDVAQGKAISVLDTPKTLRAAFTPDGGSLLSVANDAGVSVRQVPCGKLVRRFRVGTPLTLGLWTNLTNSQEIRRLDLSHHPHDCCVFDRERRLLAVADADQCIHLWDAMRGVEQHRLEGHRGLIGNLHFSPDRRWLFSRGLDSSLRWWNVADGREIQRFHEDAVDYLNYTLSRDGRLLAWVGHETIHLWDLTAAKEVLTIKGHPGGTGQVLLERDGAVLVSISADKAIRCWDAKTGRELRAINGGKQEHEDKSLFASPDGSVLVRAKHPEYALYRAVTGQTICKLPSNEIFAAATDGRTVVVSGKELVFHETASGGVVGRVPSNHRGRITCMAFSPDGNVLAVGGEDTTVLLWDWQRLTGLAKPDAAALGDKEMDSLWTDLAAADARQAYRAIGSLTAAGDKSVSLLRRRRSAAVGVGASWGKRVVELDHDEFTVREKASQELTRLGVEAYFFLRRAAAEKVSLELRRRLEQILADDEMKRPSRESLRALRAVQVLERIGTAAAREQLTDWSRGDAEAWLTQESRAALRRVRAESLFLGQE